MQQQTYRRKQLMDQADDNSLAALLTKRDQVRFREIVNTCTERRAEKRIQRTAWILSHVFRKTLCEHVNGLCPAGWLNEKSITKHWFQSVRTCPYSWALGRNISVIRLSCVPWQSSDTTNPCKIAFSTHVVPLTLKLPMTTVAELWEVLNTKVKLPTTAMNAFSSWTAVNFSLLNLI